ncbi:DUF4320 family protein [Pseudobacteroides cellulosolvens]|uniref:DUF4320 family protein n=1 Tax=Pseudobacteroides cellulosolvens ATCC 35603 = DSM 2933 TaxID=398512 RepID=A0A0L6JV23_9FIRM|nr:DUF4320 family protein [Pseudobacteroides cellulosolvens]KNY29505.1 Protein of unknown function DUF4320 [Pseudobacteroides cellulosolvens ATCC 35603 = DSM 2933]
MNKKGNSFVDACVVVLVIAMLIAVVIKVMPVFIAKQQLDTYASELCRTAEISGNIGSNTTVKSEQLSQDTGLKPTIIWSKTGDIQLNQEFTVTLTTTVNIGLFGEFASFPITLTSKATGVSEVYHK